MKDWYKQLPDNHPAMIAAIDALGWEGKGIMDKLAALLQDIGDFDLTEKILCRNFGFNTRKASRLVGILSDGFQKLREYFAKDSKVLKCFQKDSETSQSFIKLDAQNPHGSTRDLEEKIREEKKEKETLRVSKKTIESKKSSDLPDEKFQITERLERWATEDGFSKQDIERETPNFVDYHRSKGSKFKDWEAAWRNWMRNSKTFSRARAAPKPQQGSYLPGNQIVPGEQREAFSSSDPAEMRAYLEREKQRERQNA